jgi:hypothetical protein
MKQKRDGVDGDVDVLVLLDKGQGAGLGATTETEKIGSHKNYKNEKESRLNSVG